MNDLWTRADNIIGLRDCKYGPLALERIVRRCIAKAHNNLIDRRWQAPPWRYAWWLKRSLKCISWVHDNEEVVLIAHRSRIEFMRFLTFSDILTTRIVIYLPKLRSGIRLLLTTTTCSMMGPKQFDSVFIGRKLIFFTSGPVCSLCCTLVASVA